MNRNMSVNNNPTGYPSMDEPWERYYTEEDRNIKLPECTVFQNIYDRNKNNLDDIALCYFGNKISFKKMIMEVELCAKTLRAIGIKKGECVNLCTASVPESVYIVLACSRIGAIANFINPLFEKDQMKERINDTESEWMIVLDALFGYVKEVLPGTCIKNVVIIPATNSIPVVASKMLYFKSKARKILGEKDGKYQKYYSWKEFLAMGNVYADIIDVPYEKDTPTVMVYSSGSTGASKGILLTNDGINAFITAYQTAGYSDIAYCRGLVFLQMIPIWFSTGIVYSILMPLAKGFSVILEPKFSKESFADDLKKYKPELTLAATSLWLYVVNNDLDIDLSRMKYPITGGEKILPQDEKRIDDYLKKNGCRRNFCKGYGMCELGGEVSGTTDVQGYVYKSGGCGYPMLNVMVSAFDIDTDEELKYGEHGEIRVCSPARMKGYYKNPKATEDFFKVDFNGRIWGCTGDIGYVDKDGEVFILGRATDGYRMKNGKMVYFFDIEDEILKDESVYQCKVINMDLNGKMVLVSHIVLRNDEKNKNAVLTRIDQRLKDNLSNDMVPNFYKIRTSMPVHNNGKRDVDALMAETEGFIKVD